MAPGFGGADLQRGGSAGEQVVGAVEEGFGALSDQVGSGLGVRERWGENVDFKRLRRRSD